MRSPQYIREVMAGLPAVSVEAAVAFLADPSVERLPTHLASFLEAYRPPGSPPLEGVPDRETRLRAQLGLDSLALTEALIKLDELLDIHTETSEAAELTTWGELVDFLGSRLPEPVR